MLREDAGWSDVNGGCRKDTVRVPLANHGFSARSDHNRPRLFERGKSPLVCRLDHCRPIMILVAIPSLVVVVYGYRVLNICVWCT